MRKILLTFSAFALAASVNAQHLSLFEEFTGENCPPCAATNPGLLSLVTSTGNDAKILMIKYQVPIPSPGPIYNEYKTDADARKSYYQSQASIFAPSSRHDGIVYGGQYPGHAGYLNQSRIDSVSALGSPFDVEVVGVWTGTNDSLIAKVKLTAKEAVDNSNLKLRVAYVQTLHFTSAPGTNGEKDFENVVRKMYPSASGTNVTATWAANATETMTIGGPRPSHLRTDDNGFWVAWVQDDANKRVVATGKSPGDAFPTAIQEVNNAGVSEMAVYPNPTNTDATVNVRVSEATTAQVNVTDVMGRVVYSMPQMNLNKGTNSFKVATANLAAGVYSVTVNTTVGKISSRITVID